MNEFLDIAVDIAVQLESELAPLTTVTSLNSETSETRELQYTRVFDATNLDADSLSDSVTGGSDASSYPSASRAAKIRIHHSTYESLNKGMEAIQNGEVEETQWIRKITKLNKIAGDRYNFKCSLCSKTMYLIHATNDTAAIFLEEFDHQHQVNQTTTKHRIPQRTRQKVLELRAILGPKEISQWLRDNLDSDYVELTARQINDLCRQKKSPLISLATLERWCAERVVVDYNLIEDDKMFTVPVDYDYKSRGRFHVFATTKRLLRIATMITTHVCCDATYNIVIQGFPILMSGTTDKDHQFHPFCLVISKFEEAEDYGFMFKTLKSLIYEVFNHIYEPEILVGDSAAAITHGFELAFEKLVKRIVCWVHMLRAVDTHLRLVIISLKVSSNKSN